MTQNGTRPTRVKFSRNDPKTDTIATHHHTELLSTQCWNTDTKHAHTTHGTHNLIPPAHFESGGVRASACCRLLCGEQRQRRQRRHSEPRHRDNSHPNSAQGPHTAARRTHCTHVQLHSRTHTHTHCAQKRPGVGCYGCAGPAQAAAATRPHKHPQTHTEGEPAATGTTHTVLSQLHRHCDCRQTQPLAI